MSKIAIPEGYELLANHSRKNATQALALAVERGFPESAVLSISEGYLIPLGDSVEAESTDESEILDAEVTEVTIPKRKDEIIAFAEEHGIDLGDAGNNEERIAVIEAEIERRTKLAEETGVLTPADGGDTAADTSTKED